MMTDREFQRHLPEIAQDFKENQLDSKTKTKLAQFLVEKCTPHLCVFPLAPSLLDFVQRLNRAVPLKFLIRSNLVEFIMDLRLFSFVIFLEFIARYQIKERNGKYAVSSLFMQDYQHLTRANSFPDSYQIVDVKQKEQTVWKILMSIGEKMAKAILFKPFQNIFCAEYFEKNVYQTVCRHLVGVEITYVRGKVREPIVIDKNGKAQKRKADEAFKEIQS